MKNLKIILLIVATTLFVISCSKSNATFNSTPTTPPAPVQIVKDIYTCGYQYNGAIPVATVWKNNVATALTDGTKEAFANAVVVSGKDVYVVGYEAIASVKHVVKVWKNGIVINNLTDGTQYANAEGIAVSGNDVYVAGFEDDANYKRVAKVWKNGIATALPISAAATSSSAHAVVVSGSDVYVAGAETIDVLASKYIAKYWKNGIPIALTDGTTNSYVSSIAVSGNDVYVLGSELGAIKYWKNGTSTNLTESIPGDYANGITVVGTDVYIAGGKSPLGKLSPAIAKVWKNGKVTTLTDATKGGQTYAVAIIGNDVYAAGYENEPTGLVAKYWKNNVPTAIVTGSTTSSVAKSIFLTTN